MRARFRNSYIHRQAGLKAGTTDAKTLEIASRTSGGAAKPRLSEERAA